jgi:hypothetical protein
MGSVDGAAPSRCDCGLVALTMAGRILITGRGVKPDTR